MSARTDLLMDADGDLPIETRGLMPVGYSDLQHQRDMFRSFPGEWKQFIFNGVGTFRFLKSSGSQLQQLENIGRQQLKHDGYSVGNMKFSFDANNKMKILTNATR